MTAAADGLTPEPPREPWHDPVSGAWILSRYDEVLAAFRDQRLWPVDANGNEGDDERDSRGVMTLRSGVIDALAPRMEEWQGRAETMAVTLAGRLDPAGADLLREVALPWCLSIAVMVLGANESDRTKLGELGGHVFARSGSPPDSELRPRGAAAVAELNEYFRSSTFPMAQPTFIGISQTLPRLLASAWGALLRHPAELERLRADASLVPTAVEELMRYAGIIRNLYRRALEDIELGPARLAAGERVTLRIGSANRDPARFPEPDRLDVGRRATGQLALGIGRASCAGARLVRMTMAVSIRTLLRLEGVALARAMAWRTGPGFSWPEEVPVEFSRGVERPRGG